MTLLEPDHRVSFSLYDINHSEQYLSLNSSDALLLCKNLILDIKNYDYTNHRNNVNSILNYSEYYNRYNFTSSYDELLGSALIDRVNNLEIIYSKLFSGSLDSKKESIVELQNMFFYYKNLRLWQSEWFLYPEIYFSYDFYEKYIPSFSEILFTHYEYDTSKNSAFKLPLFEPFNADLSSYEDGIIPIHYLDHARCTVLLEELQSNVIGIGTEAELLQSILSIALNNGYYLTVTNQID